ncbi:microtubule-associated tumor suppressor candidate 2 [Chanos chanos]|uniref:Microtubule-associated tumor suppressor candidate 2 n=1 Tax=Chanos chanos TaxID=29144 RepID=A0A6J2VJW8_CHACN|nr:microtubule-associated tumor suppressor candidate 2-like [Chanos chanos]
MSVKDEHFGPVDSRLEEGQSEIRNNNRQTGVATDGDANANEIQRGDGNATEVIGTFSSLVSHSEEQDKIIIWGTDSQCDDPELAEFEMLECQELEAYLVEEDETYCKDSGAIAKHLSYKATPAEAMRSKDDSGEDKSASQHFSKEHEPADSQISNHKGIETERTGAEYSSENDVFVSCLSTMSSLTSQSCLTISDRSRSTSHGDGAQVHYGKSTTHVGSVDLNLNSTVLAEEPILEAQENQPAQDMRISPCKESSGPLTNSVSECNWSISNAKREHNQTVSSHQDTEDTQCLPVEEHELRHEPSVQRKGYTEAKTISDQQCLKQAIKSESIQSLSATEKTQQEIGHKIHSKQFQGEENSDLGRKTSESGSKGTTTHPLGTESKAFKKQGSFERARSASPSSLEKRRPWGSPSRPATPPSPKTQWSPRRRVLSSPAKAASPRATSQERSDSPQRSGIRPPSKSHLSSSIPKPIPPPQPPKAEPESKNLKSSPPQKPKNVRPKIITYVRKNPQVKTHSAEGPYEVSTLPPRLTAYTSPSATKEQKAGGSKASPVLSSSNILYDKYRQEMQRTGHYSPGLHVTGLRPPGHSGPHKLVGKSESFHGELPEKYLYEVGRGSGGPSAPQFTPHEVAGVYRSPRTLRPQLGVGAVARQPAAKNRIMMTGQRSSLTLSHPISAAQPTHFFQDATVEQKKPPPETAPKSLLPKPGQSGLRPPGFSHLPAARLAAFGFVRSASVSSVSSNQSNDSTHSDPCRPSTRPSSGSEETPPHKPSLPPGETSRPSSRGSPQPPNTPAPTRRSLIPPPRSSPVASRKEFQKDADVARPPLSSPKRFAVVSPKPQSPVRQKSCVARLGGSGGGVQVEAVDVERAVLLQRLREHCEEQSRQIHSLQAELKKATLGLEVFAITTQHFCLKSENAAVKERELSLELARIRDEVADTVARWERLQGEKQDLEQRFERELRSLREQQQSELEALQERLKAQHLAEIELLRQEQGGQLQLLRSQHQDQMEKMNESHEAAMCEMDSTHSATLATLQEEHARTVKNLKMAHEQQIKSLEEEFEKLRLSLQDQVDTLTFQNRSLRDRAKRFEEALRKSTDEQIVDALAPYQHIEEDLKSLKEVLEMKNQQIHEQELKIAELEKMAQKNVVLEERVQVLQQQNEDLKARIDLNLAISRQLSEENANLQEYVEKESNEKKRLSRTNEELLWRLQTGELSPHMSPTQSPMHRASSGPSSPSRLQQFPR